MTNKAIIHREKIAKVIEQETFEHQRQAANKAHIALNSGSRAVVIAAEMQSGKSGISLALACLQRQSLDDTVICDRKQLKDTLYLVTMADIALFDQAKHDLSACPNVVVSNFNNFRQALSLQFKNQQPKLIIIDECHYGSSSDAVRYSKVFDYLEKENQQCKVGFISATPFSALYAAGGDSILRHNFQTRLVFHKTSDEYHGIRQMHSSQQIIKLAEEQRDFCNDSLLRRRFIRSFNTHQGPGWSLIRVPNNSAHKAKKILLDTGIEEDQIYIIGQKLTGIPDEELSSINDFKQAYETAVLFDEKIVAITVAGFRAGINFGHAMKEQLIATWDSTIANIAAVVQANIGRACGYHQNTEAKHYTNLDAIQAYSDLLNHLEQTDQTDDFEGLRQVFEKICTKYEVNGFDRGTPISPQKESIVIKKLANSKTYITEGYLCVPAQLHNIHADFTQYTQDPELLEAIRHIRNELLKDNGPFRKKGRALRVEHQNSIKAQWVNGATYDNHTESSAKERTIRFIEAIDNSEPIEFNKIIKPSGGETTEDKKIMASIFSLYNLSRQIDAFKRAMDEDDMLEICDLLKVKYDSSVIVLFKRGELLNKKEHLDIQHSHIKNQSVFKNN